MLHNLYQAGLLHVLYVTPDVTLGDIWDTLGKIVAKRLKVPPCLRRPARRTSSLAGESGYAQAGVEVSQHTQPPFGNVFMQL